MQLLSWHTTLHRLNTSLVQRTIDYAIVIVAHNITPFKYITCTKNYSIMQLLSWHTTLHLLNTSLVKGTIQLCNCYHGTQHYTV